MLFEQQSYNNYFVQKNKNKNSWFLGSKIGVGKNVIN